jgi:MFS family permease
LDRQKKRGWIIVAVLFVAMFLIWGPANAGGVFFLPVINSFGWTRAMYATLSGTGALMAGASGPVVGWLIDRVGARKVMIAGAIAFGLCYFALSRATSFVAFMLLFSGIGVGVTATTLIPASLVVTNWFREQRGVALGITFAGIPLGGTGITMLANYAVTHFGWRVGYMVMGLPIVAIVIPLLAIVVQTRPVDWTKSAEGFETLPAAVMPGLEVAEALRTRSFWMVSAAQLLSLTAFSGASAHFIPYLVGLGCSATTAASMSSAVFAFSAAGTFLIGPVADRLNGRTALALVYALGAIGLLMLLGARSGVMLGMYVVLFGLVANTPTVLIPIVMVESLGIRRLGSVMGLSEIFATIGFAAGPVLAGRIFDVTRGYLDAFTLFVVLAIASAAAVATCLPLAVEQSRIARAAASSAA